MNRMMHIIAAALCVAAVQTASALTTHRMANSDIVYSDGFITSAGVLVFPGKTLADLEGCSYWGRLAGGSVSRVRTALSNEVKPFPEGATGDAIERYDFDLVGYEDPYIKAVHIQLYNGDGGVYAKSVNAWSRQTTDGAQLKNVLYTVNQSTGELTWDTSKATLRSVATSATSTAYGIREIGVARPLSATSQLVFPGFTVSKIAKNAAAKMSARISGGYVGGLVGIQCLITNVVTIAGTEENPTAIRAEAQLLDGTSVKCAVFTLTDGEGGVYAQLTHAPYVNGVDKFGTRLVDDDGNVVSGVSSSYIASALLDAGYGIYNLEINEEARHDPYPAYVFDRNEYLTGTAQLVFPGATLDELTNCTFYGIIEGGWISDGDYLSENGFAVVVKRYPEDIGEEVQKIFLQMSINDGGTTKNVVVELTDGTGGVYGRAIKASYRKGDYRTTQSFGITSDGSSVTNYTGFTGGTVATSDHRDGYGVRKLGTARVVQSTATLAFPGLTVADIFRGEILARTAGAWITDCKDYAACNRVITSTDATTGAITGFRDEMQYVDGALVKSIELRFTDGEDGVYVQGVRACYADSPYHTVGRRMIAQDDSGKADGTTAGTVSGGFYSGGYGACGVAVALPDDLTGPATAVWNGGDPSLTSSWTCKKGDGTALADTLPDKYTQVIISDSINMTADADLTQYASVMTTAAGFTIDTKGYKLYVKSLDPWHSATITDTVGGGELHLVVPEGYQTYNNIFALSGKLKLVMEGDGIYLPVKVYQTYSGGSEIKSGVVMPYLNQNLALRNWCMGGNGIAKASGQVITIDEGGTLDLNANKHLGYVTFNLNGGTIVGASENFNPALSLNADSSLHVTGAFTFHGLVTTMNGHTLDITIDEGQILNYTYVVVGPGTFNIDGGGWLKMATADINMTNVNLVMTNGALQIEKAVSVNDYYSSYTVASRNIMTDAGSLNVYGTFTPASDYFTGATMQNGSTIDLSGKTNTWSTTSLFTSGSNTVVFADSATVNIDIGDRSLKNGTQLVSWTTAPANLDTLAFSCVNTTDERISLVKKSDGLYVWKGMFLIVR